MQEDTGLNQPKPEIVVPDEVIPPGKKSNKELDKEGMKSLQQLMSALRMVSRGSR
jgi:hypothetical protein